MIFFVAKSSLLISSKYSYTYLNIINDWKSSSIKKHLHLIQYLSITFHFYTIKQKKSKQQKKWKEILQ